MTLKAKLISSILAFIMVASLMMVGIFASPTVTLQMGGNVSFSANGVYADITGNIVGTQDHPTGSPLQLSTISIDYTNTETEVDLSGENSDWTTMPLTFDENGSEITVTMNIQNKASDRAIKVTITDNTNIENVTVARAYNSTTFSSNTDTQTINSGESGSYTFKLSVNSQNSPASGSFSLDVRLETAGNILVSQVYSELILDITTDTETVRVDSFAEEPVQVRGSEYEIKPIYDPGLNITYSLIVNEETYANFVIPNWLNSPYWNIIAQDKVTVLEEDHIIKFTITENSVIELVEI